MRSLFLLLLLFLVRIPVAAQPRINTLLTYPVGDDIRVTVDHPARVWNGRETILVFYALPNGNTAWQTMGKKMEPGDDWHFDIQHIGAQTAFIRKQLRNKNVIVLYLANSYMSWPHWKQQHPDFKELISRLVDSLASVYGKKKYSIYLNGHSGGGSFIFGYLAAVPAIPSAVKRISFIDSNYGYDSIYYPKLRNWLQQVKGAALNVFAYNDSLALYNGKPVVSPTGGTWYRSWLMVRHFSQDWPMDYRLGDSIHTVMNPERNIWFFFKSNPDRGIYHTQQVELNGFIHSILCGTKYDSRNYRYYAGRAYGGFIE